MRRLLVLSAAASLVMLLAVPASADSPVFMERFVDEFADEDPGLAGACGLSTVHVEGRVQGVFKLYEDDHLSERVTGKITFTGPNGEGPVQLSFGLAHEGDPVSESFDPSTGLLTLVFEDTFRGNPEKWRIPGVGVIAIDSGFISWTVTLVIDTTTDELISEELSNVVIHGPHPIFENGFSLSPEDLAMVCAALGA